MLTIKKSFLFLFLIWSFIASSQVLSSQLNKTTLALGEVAEYRIRIDDLNGKNVVAAPKNELLPFHFEGVKDSISKEQNVYSRVVEFAVFDEGIYKIPALEIKVGDKILTTIPYEVEVINTAQKGDVINDIMKNKQVDLGVKDYWELYKFYILAALVVIAIIFLIFYFIKNGRRSNSGPKVYTNQTLKDLEALKKKNYIQNDDYRSFYVELIDISRRFISKQYKIPADVLLTDDLLDYMKSNNVISQNNEDLVKDVFLRGDLVKFAKILPTKELMETDFENIKTMVKSSTKDVEVDALRNMN